MIITIGLVYSYLSLRYLGYPARDVMVFLALLTLNLVPIFLTRTSSSHHVLKTQKIRQVLALAETKQRMITWQLLYLYPLLMTSVGAFSMSATAGPERFIGFDLG